MNNMQRTWQTSKKYLENQKGVKLDPTRANSLCKSAMLESHRIVVGLQKFIDEWDDPTDLASRMAATLQKTNQMHAKVLLGISQLLENNCKHPKKMQDTCDGIVYCMNCNADLKKVKIKKTIKKS